MNDNKIVEMFTGPLTDENGESYNLKISVFENEILTGGRVKDLHTVILIERQKDNKMVHRMVTRKLNSNEIQEQAILIGKHINTILRENGIFDN